MINRCIRKLDSGGDICQSISISSSIFRNVVGILFDIAIKIIYFIFSITVGTFIILLVFYFCIIYLFIIGSY